MDTLWLMAHSCECISMATIWSHAYISEVIEYLQGTIMKFKKKRWRSMMILFLMHRSMIKCWGSPGNYLALSNREWSVISKSAAFWSRLSVTKEEDLRGSGDPPGGNDNVPLFPPLDKYRRRASAASLAKPNMAGARRDTIFICTARCPLGHYFEGSGVIL